MNAVILKEDRVIAAMDAIARHGKIPMDDGMLA